MDLFESCVTARLPGSGRFFGASVVGILDSFSSIAGREAVLASQSRTY